MCYSIKIQTFSPSKYSLNLQFIKCICSFYKYRTQDCSSRSCLSPISPYITFNLKN